MTLSPMPSPSDSRCGDKSSASRAGHQTRINTILLVADESERQANRESEPLMRQIANETGGVFTCSVIDQLR